MTPIVREHAVQFYGTDEEPLANNVADFLATGLSEGHEAIVIATETRTARIVRALRARGRVTHGDNARLTLLDAQRTLASFLDHGFPDEAKFEQTVGRLIRNALERSSNRGVSGYGEMVGVLWQAGKYPAAIRLEQLWNKLLGETEARLFCGYPIDIFSSEFNASVLNALFCAHSRLVSEDSSRTLEAALNRALDEVLGAERSGFDAMKSPIPASRDAMPVAEETILRLRSSLPRRADDVLSRAKEYYLGTS